MPPFLRPLARLVAIAVVAWALWFANDRIGFRPDPWLADLAVLEDSAAAGYANLDWQVRRGVTDPAVLHRHTDSLIRHAGSRSRASAALRSFAAAFQDGHFSVRRPTPRVIKWIEDRFRGREAGAPMLSGGARKGCAALGYSDQRRPSNLTALPDYREVGPAEAAFPTGMLAVDDRNVGVVRIDAFGVDRFGTACESAWGATAATDSAGRCASRCQGALWHATSDTLLAEIRHAIGRLHEAGAGAILVDLTGNGGGNDWVAPAARQFTALPLAGHRAGVIRHPHHRGPLIDALASLTSARRATQSDAWRASIDSAIATASRQLELVNTPCNRRRIWTDGAESAQCSQLATEAYTTGFLPYVPASAHDQPGAGDAFTPAAFHYREGAWTGPVVILVDHRTASASEDFVVALRDNGAARVIGERTLGAGCGYTNGGIGFALPNSHLEVRMPDCARIRNNGDNEVSGIEPDVAVGWKDTDPAHLRLEKTISALRVAVNQQRLAVGRQP